MEPLTTRPKALIRRVETYRLPCASCNGRGYRIRPVQPIARLPFVARQVAELLAVRGLRTIAAAEAAIPQLHQDMRFGSLALVVLEQAIYARDRRTLARLFPGDPAAIQEGPPAPD